MVEEWLSAVLFVNVELIAKSGFAALADSSSHSDLPGVSPVVSGLSATRKLGWTGSVTSG
jgi:hypothetical protein